MPLSRAEIQKRYRERKKLEEGRGYLEKESRRQRKYYVPVANLSTSEKRKRNESIKKRVRKHRLSKATEQNRQVSDIDSESGYSTQQSSSRLVVKLPLRRNGPKRRINNALKSANTKLRRIIKLNIESNKKVRTLQRKLQRLQKPKSRENNMTPRRKTAMFMKSSGLRGEHIRRQLLVGNVLLHQIKTSADKCDKKKRHGVYSAAAGDILRKYRCVAKVAGELKISRQKLADVIKKGVDFTKVRRRRVMMKFRESVTAFLEREDNCRLQPGKKDATTCENGKVQTRIMTGECSSRKTFA